MTPPKFTSKPGDERGIKFEISNDNPFLIADSDSPLKNSFCTKYFVDSIYIFVIFE